MPSLKPTKSFLGLSWSDRFLLLETTLWLALARLAVLVVPFRRLAPWLGATMAESPPAEPRLGSGGWRLG